VKFISKSETETREFGRRLSRRLKGGDVIALYGELGSGKTMLTKGICEGLGVKEVVKSPSFTIITTYKSEIPVHHIDLYRIKSNEIQNIGLEEYISDFGICIIEWAERAKDFLPEKRINIFLKIINEKTREINYEMTKPD
jgi:tRNA threonylcarbamoyladenosine biosynthesis protein TsaE